MATTVMQAFNEFLNEIVNVDSDVSKTARSSRDWLLGQISKFKEKEDTFPKLYSGIDIHFGSFARKTKIDTFGQVCQLCVIDEGKRFLC